MEPFNLVIFGFSGNLTQLKIIPALYDLEAKGMLSPDTRIIGIGRKDIEVKKYIPEVLAAPNRHHQHKIESIYSEKLISKTSYIREDISKDREEVYKKLTTLNGNTLYYLATFPDLYQDIFVKLKKYKLNKNNSGWTKILIEKPIGQDYASAKKLNLLLSEYFSEDQIFRVDHYLGKDDLQKVFNEKIQSNGVDHIQISVLEDFGIGKRAGYYDVTGALVDMGQNHLLQMLAAVTKEEPTLKGREGVLSNLVADSKNIIFGQYEGYLNEENVNKNSTTDTYFALKTTLNNGEFKNIPIYLRSGKKLSKSEARMTIVNKDGRIKTWLIKSDGTGNKLDPYEKLIIESVAGNQIFFNSANEIEFSWKFIDALRNKNIKPFVYKLGTDGPKEAGDLIKKDGREWV